MGKKNHIGGRKNKKVRKARRYMHNIDRKRKRNKEESTGKTASTVAIVKKEWDEKKSFQMNLTSFGLAYDPNVTLKIPTIKESVKPIIAESFAEDDSDMSETENTPVIEKGHVAEEVEKLARAPRERRLKLPKGQVRLLTYYIKKYKDDYVAMSKDFKNIYQETPRQIQRKVKMLQNVQSRCNEETTEAKIPSDSADVLPNKQPKFKKFTRKEREWLTYCLNRYGNNYEAMAQDVKNEFKDSSKLIRRHITQFRRNPKYWSAYTASNVKGVYLANKEKESME